MIEFITKYMEYVYLVLGVVFCLYAGYHIYHGGFAEQGSLLLLPAICVAAYFFRRTVRVKFEAMERRERGE
ncbi:MAG: hypothetical protein HKN32_03790 [Flavobacteriales bacterium]|nr:hypothetical protein [Flavobacteriales bacterium]